MEIVEEKPKEWGFVLHSAQLKNGKIYHFDWCVYFKGIIVHDGVCFEFSDNIEIFVEVQRNKNQIIADIGLVARCKAPCSRCLETVVLDLKQNFRYFYTPCVSEEERIAIESDEHVVIIEEDLSLLDLGDQVWECLVMALPEKVLCDEACKGLCPYCGMNLNKGNCDCFKKQVDPRLSPLSKLWKDMEE